MAQNAKCVIPKQEYRKEKPMLPKKAIVHVAEGDAIDFYSNLIIASDVSKKIKTDNSRAAF